MPDTMFAITVDGSTRQLRPARVPIPHPGPGEILLRVLACGVCRTDLHILDGELAPHRPGVVPGHEIVGEVVERGAGSERFALGERVGVPWLGHACGYCPHCKGHRENLCDAPSFTGYDRDGGFAEFAVADEQFCLALPQEPDAEYLAPLLCAGLIGYRTWRMAGGPGPRRIGIWGFGAAAHIVCQLAVHHGQSVYAFTRPGDRRAQDFAMRLGASWAEGSDHPPPDPLDAALVFAPAGELVPQALAHVRKGGVVVCGGIHMSDIPSFPYYLLWGERQLRSVANLTRADGQEFFELLRKVPLRTHVTTYSLSHAPQAVDDLRHGRVTGAAVLVPERQLPGA